MQDYIKCRLLNHITTLGKDEKIFWTLISNIREMASFSISRVVVSDFTRLIQHHIDMVLTRNMYLD